MIYDYVVSASVSFKQKIIKSQIKNTVIIAYKPFYEPFYKLYNSHILLKKSKIKTVYSSLENKIFIIINERYKNIKHGEN
jgi:hypothetical protein